MNPLDAVPLGALITSHALMARVFDRLLPQAVNACAALLVDAAGIVEDELSALSEGVHDAEFEGMRADLKASLYGICDRILTTSLTDTESAMKLALEQLMACDATAGRVVILNPSAFEQ